MKKIIYNLCWILLGLYLNNKVGVYLILFSIFDLDYFILKHVFIKVFTDDMTIKNQEKEIAQAEFLAMVSSLFIIGIIGLILSYKYNLI